MAAKKKHGNSIYTEEIAIEICERISDGESLRAICRDKDMPARRTVFYWLGRYPEFLARYKAAREEQMETFADEILEIADNDARDWEPKKDADGNIIGVVVNGEAINRSRLRVDTRKWLMSKIVPKKYGDKSEVNMSVSYAEKSDEELLARLAELEAAASGGGSD